MSSEQSTPKSEPPVKFKRIKKEIASESEGESDEDTHHSSNKHKKEHKKEKKRDRDSHGKKSKYEKSAKLPKHVENSSVDTFKRCVQLNTKYKKGEHPIKAINEDFFTLLLVGEPFSGKSHLTKWITETTVDKYDYVLVLSASGGLNRNYNWIDPRLVHRKYDRGFFQRIQDFMADLNKDGKNKHRCLVILDDILGLFSFLTPEWKNFISTFRNFGIDLIISVQYLNSEVPALTRNCITDYFIFRHQITERNVLGLHRTIGEEGWDEYRDFKHEVLENIGEHEFIYYQRRDKDIKDTKERYRLYKAPEHIPKFQIKVPEEEEDEEADASEPVGLFKPADMPEEV